MSVSVSVYIMGFCVRLIIRFTKFPDVVVSRWTRSRSTAQPPTSMSVPPLTPPSKLAWPVKNFEFIFWDVQGCEYHQMVVEVKSNEKSLLFERSVSPPSLPYLSMITQLHLNLARVWKCQPSSQKVSHKKIHDTKTTDTSDATSSP